MQKIIRSIAFEIFTLYLLSLLFAGVIIRGGLQGLLWTGLIVSVIAFFVRPILSAILTPITVITFGATYILINAVILFIATKATSDLVITAFRIPRLELWGFSTPSMFFSPLIAFLVVGAGQLVIKLLLRWLCKE